MASPRQASLAFIFVSLFLNVLGIGLMIPLLPELVSHFFGSDVSAAARAYGLLAMSYAAMQFVCAPLLGALSDRYGRRPVLLLAALGSGLDYLVMAMAPTYAWLLGARLVSGMTGASLSVGMAYIADITEPEKRAQSFGLVGAAFGLGFILGPAVSGLLGQVHLSLPFYLAAVLTLGNFLYGWLILPESLAPELRRPFAWRRANPIGAFKLLVSSPLMLRLAAVYLLLNLAQAGLESTWVLFTKFRYGWTPLLNGLSLTMVGVCAALVQGLLIRRLMPRFGEKKLMVLSLITGIVSFSLYALANQGWMIYPVIALNSLMGLAGPAAQGLLSQVTPADEQGALQGALSSLSTLSRAIGPLAGAGLFAYFTSPAAPFLLDGVAFWLGAVLLAIALLLILPLFRVRAV